MKDLSSFIQEANTTPELIDIFTEALNASDDITLQNVYEALFDKMFTISEGKVNEGFFSNLGKKLANIGNKAATSGEKLDSKISQASDAAKKAIETAKKKAGNAWDKVKDTYSSVVVAVDDAVQQGKESIEALCKQAKLKIDGFEAKAAQIYSNAIASSEETAKKIGEWTADKTKGAQKFAAVNTLLAGAMLAKAAGVEAGVAIDILAAAGFK